FNLSCDRASTDNYIVKFSQVPLGVKGIEMEKSYISLYPNPASGIFTLNFGRQITNGRIKLINLLGQTVLEQSDVNSISLSLDIADQPKGMYFMEVSDGGNVERMKVV